MSGHVLDFDGIGNTALPLVGGKGANLGELSRIEGIEVPGGFCVTTEAYRAATARIEGLAESLAQLGRLEADDRAAVNALAARIRALIDSAPIPEDIQAAVTARLAERGECVPYAVRSSATAEDLPYASFAGQQETYLNVVGADAVLRHISRCWASLFTERAVVYRMQNGFDHQKVYLSVVVEEMVFPEASGIMFTADPVNSDRTTVSIEAGFGLGEALVSGLVDADLYKVRSGEIASKKISTKQVAIYARPEGGTRQVELDTELQHAQTLTDQQILRLEQTGRVIEAHFGRPQDIEWCLAGGKVYVLQSRAITTLFPIPQSDDSKKDGKNHVYMSMSHQQQMTDVMRPLGISMFQIGFRKLASQPIVGAGGRIYMDVSRDLSSSYAAKIFVYKGLGSADLLIQKALASILDRKDYVRTLSRGMSFGITGGSLGQILSGLLQAVSVYRRNDPGLVNQVIEANTKEAAKVAKAIAGRTGADLFDFIVRDMDIEYRQVVLDNYGIGFIMLYAQHWLHKTVKNMPGEENATDVLAQSLSNNVTAQMGLELLDVADVVRKHPAVLTYFEHANDTTFFDDLAAIDGGADAATAIHDYLDKYGMRCPGEIDITKTRWAEQPTMLIPLILNNINNFPPASHSRLFQEKLQQADTTAERIIRRLEHSRGRRKAKQARKMISLYRNFIGFREYPKYALMQRHLVYKHALRREAMRLASLGVIHDPSDADYLSFEEFRQAAHTHQADQALIDQRRRDDTLFQRLTPPRVITSTGEVVTGSYDAGDLPDGALIGVPVSSGIVEGRARVIHNLQAAQTEAGDILVTAFTDPSWTPLFVTIAGLVSEVGGMMTHGAIVAREYGLPAVVSVENATRLIRDGQRIRINGTAGYVELLD
ncbi:rifamycin-inactivating phosphotransferase [Nonomuraea sp. NPDC049028]|uniref:rifamycin-inactivating phosphotransferase n=1 Tax=Nonomuraea sp. NPDC049028 TaxID=3364348 RepID=UPI003715382B